jgi:hypothetical protein
VPFARRDEANTAVAEFLVAPAHKAQHPVTDQIDVRKAVRRVVQPALGGPEQRLGGCVVVTNTRSAVRGNDT